MLEDWFSPHRNFCGLSGPMADYDRARALVLPVPYDSTTSYKAGTREGPEAILDASQYLELFDHELVRETADIGIHTLPPVVPVMAGPAEMVGRLYQIARELVASDKLLVTLGGEHSLSSAAVKAFAERYPRLTVLQFDAHADLRDEYEETAYSHACVARRIVEICPLVQVGVRSLSSEEWTFLQTASSITTFFADEHPLAEESVERLVAALGPEVYITFDLDVLGFPASCPGWGRQSPAVSDGRRSYAFSRRVAQQRRLVGFDLMEYCPPEGNTAGAFTAAKLAYKLIGYSTHPWAEERR